MALPLGEDGDEHVGARHLLASRGLDVDHGALDHPLEPCRRLQSWRPSATRLAQFGIDVFDEVAAQGVEIDVAGAHDGGRVLIVDQRQKQMFERGVFVPPLAREGEGSMKGLFKAAGEARQGLGVLWGVSSLFFSMTH